MKIRPSDPSLHIRTKVAKFVISLDRKISGISMKTMGGTRRNHHFNPENHIYIKISFFSCMPRFERVRHTFVCLRVGELGPVTNHFLQELRPAFKEAFRETSKSAMASRGRNWAVSFVNDLTDAGTSFFDVIFRCLLGTSSMLSNVQSEHQCILLAHF